MKEIISKLLAKGIEINNCNQNTYREALIKSKIMDSPQPKTAELKQLNYFNRDFNYLNSEISMIK